MAVKPIPDGYHTITPYLIVKDAAGFMEFLKKALSAEEVYKTNMDDGTVMHAEMKIGDSMVMIAEASEKFPARQGLFYLYVPDVDASYKQAIGAGAISVMEPSLQFYGDRNAGVKDDYGNTWWMGTHVEDVSPEEMKRRQEEMKKKK